MNNGETNWRADPALIGILDEATAWAVRGTKAVVLAQAASLRAALVKAADLERDGQTIVALTQQPHDRIIVFSSQIGRLREASEG